MVAGRLHLGYAAKNDGSTWMSTDRITAFDRLDVRVGNDAAPLDRISLRDHVVRVEIGAFQVERGSTQQVACDVVVEVAPPKAPLGDDVDRILSYEMLVEAIAQELAAERMNLLETLAERIADRILRAPQAIRVFLRIQKLDLGPGALGVEIVRSKDGADPQVQAGIEKPVPHPLVVYLSNAAIHSGQLTSWLDQLQANEKPVILCVGPADLAAPVSAVVPAQRRIDLLSIEQNSWVLAGRDTRCLVVDTRAEFEWAARKHRMSVWAPSKIVLDAVSGPLAPPGDAVGLVQWFAVQMEAERLILVDAAVPARGPARGDVPLTSVALEQSVLPT